jgi:hypothetical protein
VKVGQTKKVKIVVNVSALENVTMIWHGPQGNQLHPDGKKYDIKSRNNQTILKVFNLNLDDAGMYRLYAYNRIGNNSLNRLLIVQGKNHDTNSLKFCLSCDVNECVCNIRVWKRVTTNPWQVDFYEWASRNSI